MQESVTNYPACLIGTVHVGTVQQLCCSGILEFSFRAAFREEVHRVLKQVFLSRSCIVSKVRSARLVPDKTQHFPSANYRVTKN